MTELRKEWREVADEFFKKQDSLHHGTYFQATKWQLDDLALRLQSLADKERREARQEGYDIGVLDGVKLAEGKTRAAHTPLKSQEDKG